MGRFVSIFFIVALGVAFYSGIRASEPSMRFTADQYFDDSKLMDLKVMGTMGLTKADIKAIGKVSGIEAVTTPKLLIVNKSSKFGVTNSYERSNRQPANVLVIAALVNGDDQ